MTRLDGKLALVTGGGRNVGKAIASELGLRGAHVLINYFHSPDAARQTAAELAALGVRVDLIRASVARQDQVDRMFAEIEERFGYLDILVNNAASGALLPLAEITDEHLDKAIDTNYKGGLRCARAAAPLLARRGGGAIVTVSALGSSNMVMAGYLACAPAKAAAEAVTRYLAVEFAPLNIRVNTASAAMLTGEVADAFPRAAEMQEVIRSSTPLGRLGDPRDLAAVVAFLASDDARWITGQVVLADGGLSLGASLLSPPPPEPVGTTRNTHTENVHTENVDTGDPGTDDLDTDDIAIVGMGLAVPGANSPEEYWDLRLTGAELFVRPPEDRWDRASFHSPDESAEDKTYQDRCGFITGFRPDVTSALPGVYGEDQEFTTAWLRHSVAQALRGVHRTEGDRVAFLVGYTPDGGLHLEHAGILASARDRLRRLVVELGIPGHRTAAILSALDSALTDRYRPGSDSPSRFLPDRVARAAMAGLLPDSSEVQMVDTACSSSMYAIDIGVKSLLLGKQDIAVCGGAFAPTPRSIVMFAKLHGLSRQGAVRAMDDAADGVLFADGAGIVVLKRLGRALRDGDRVLGVIRSVGTSSDGRGTAIYAPNPAGQDLAVRRALSGPVPAEGVDWVLAHATGTPAGDLAEFSTIRKYFHAGGPRYLTSNKSLIGHTGWAAGVVSVIETVLALRHDTIPGQYRLDTPHRDFRLDETGLRIPTVPVPWPAEPDRARAAAVSGFGFGGTNAHLIVQEHTPARVPAPPDQRARDARSVRIAIVGWSTRLPGMPTAAHVERWLAGIGPAPDDSFGDRYPAPPFDRIRLPPTTVRMMDRCQLMLVECVHELYGQLGEAWREHAETTGVFVGNMGPTRAGMLLGDRVYLDQVTAALRADPRTAALPELDRIIDAMRADVRARIEKSNEDSFPGMMPNIISARVANRFDLNGPNITVDAGLGSALTAIDTAARYLRMGELRLALAAGVNGNSLPELEAILGDALGPALPDTAGLAEGAVMFALTTEPVAVAEGLPILAFVDGLVTGERGDQEEPPAGRQVIECGTSNRRLARYVGAAGGLGVLSALHGSAGRTVSVRCAAGPGQADLRLTLMVPGRGAAELPARYRDTERFAPDRTALVRTHVPALRPAPARAAGPSVPFLPAGVVVLTNLAEPDLALPPDALVFSTTSTPRPTPELVRGLLAGHDGPVRHVRVVADLSRSAGGPHGQLDGALIALHDALFLVVREAVDDLSSVLVLLAGGLRAGVPHPAVGLYTGLVKTVDIELPHCTTFALVTASPDMAAGMGVAERESGRHRTFPVVFDDHGRRLVPVLTEKPVELADEPVARLGPDAVVFAVAGARGITAEIVKALARDFRPRLYLIGSNRLDDYPAGVFAGDDATFAAGRTEFIRTNLGRDSVARLNAEFDRMSHAKAARRTIAELAEYCGADRVTYLACDVTDEEAVNTVVAKVLAESGQVDLLINAAGRNHSALIRDKDFAEFQRIRDIKLRGYQNLKAAFADRPPAIWCNFGSLLGYFGQRGEADYASGNDFLAAAAMHADREGNREYTVGWTFWDGVGMVGAGGSLANTRFKKVGSYSDMSPEEGVHHFVRELHAVHNRPSTVHLGAAERRMVAGIYPGYLAEPAPAPAPGPGPGPRFYLRELRDRTDRTVTYETPFDLNTDAYLRDHLVRNVPTLPGAFVGEIAAEAALDLVPGATVIGYRETCFHNFLHVYPDMPTPVKRVAARNLGTADGITTVEVRIGTDVVAPSGVVLVRDKPHFSTLVLLAARYPAAPDWAPWPDREIDVPAEESFRMPGAVIMLSGPFLCVAGIRRSVGRARATFQFTRSPEDPLAGQFVAPPYLLDALVRTGFVADADGRDAPVSAPTRIERVELFEAGNDWDLMRRYGSLGLYASVVGDGPERTHHLVATAPDGHVIARCHGLNTAVVDW